MNARIPSILCIALGCFVQMGCDIPTAPETLSNAFIKFDPRGEFAAHGFHVEQTKGPGLVSPKNVYGWRPFQGSIVLPPNSTGCELVAQAVHDALDQVVHGDCEFNKVESSDRHSGQPFFATFRYSEGGVQGLVYVWLFPDDTETRINYAILQHEEQLATVD